LNYATFLVQGGRKEEGVAEARRAVELDPASLEANTFLCGILYLSRRYDQALQQCRATVALEPNYWFSRMFLGTTLEQQGDFSGALDELQKATRVETEIPWPTAELGSLYARRGRKADAEKVLADLLHRAQTSYVTPYNLACVYAGLGQKDQAFAALEKAYQDHSLLLMALAVDPGFDSLHSDPRFAVLLRKIHFPQ
jgi:tetratricopeptide (TPR) repeat protein